MTTVDTDYYDRLHHLADLMVAVAGESVTVLKQTAPEQALVLKRQNEWNLYLEFLKIMFNLADRLVALHIPLKDQMDFMNRLEDTVTARLNAALASAFGSHFDPMELTLTIGTAVADSRRTYEPYTFLITEDSKTKSAMFHDFGKKIATLFGAPGHSRLSSAAELCASAVVPAMEAILRDHGSPPSAQQTPVEATTVPPQHHPDQTDQSPRRTQTSQQHTTGGTIKLISMAASMAGDMIETRWGLHPRFREDLTPDELRQLTSLLNRVAKIVGQRYASMACSARWAPPSEQAMLGGIASPPASASPPTT
ncbi:MAG: hypothetical protein NNA18_10690 [Nitrospira sp.]|nr:hypothetical protein [Nitrospira sp.]